VPEGPDEVEDVLGNDQVAIVVLVWAATAVEKRE
jgi:hypothetical protein